MTSGPPARSILLFTIPMLLGNILQLLYSTVDSIIVGQYSGTYGLSAIGVSMPIQFFFAVFFMAVGIGVGVLVSQYFGAKDKDNLSKTVGTALVLIFFTSLVATALGLLISDWVLRITNCPTEVFDYAKSYMRIIFIGFIGMGFYNVLAGILRGIGNSTFPLLVLAGTTVLNIFLDIWFVARPDQLSFGLGMGVAGAAWATIISQAVSAIVCFLRIMKMRDTLTLNRSTIKITKRIAKLIVRIGLPSGVQQMLMSMSFILVQSFVNAVRIPFNGILDGSLFVAVNTSVMRLDQFAMMPAQAFNMTASTFTGQNLGAGKVDRVMQGFKIILTMAMSVSVIMIIVMLLFSPQLLGLFINDPDPARTVAITDLGIRMIRIMVVVYAFMAVSFTVGGVLRGAGDTMTQLIISIATNVAFRVPLVIVLMNVTKSAEYPGGRPEAIYISMIIGFGMHMLVNTIYFSRGRWKTRNTITRPGGLRPQGTGDKGQSDRE